MVNVPLERPEKFGNRLQLTDAEFKQVQETVAKERELALKDFDQNKLADVEALGDFGDATSPPPNQTLIVPPSTHTLGSHSTFEFHG